MKRATQTGGVTRHTDWPLLDDTGLSYFNVGDIVNIINKPGDIIRLASVVRAAVNYAVFSYKDDETLMDTMSANLIVTMFSAGKIGTKRRILRLIDKRGASFAILKLWEISGKVSA